MQMPMTRLWMEELGMKHLPVETEEFDREAYYAIKDEYRCGEISRVAFIEQATGLGVARWQAEYDAAVIDTEDDYDRTPDT
jgi:hypothetical protein